MQSYVSKQTGMEVVNLGAAGWQDEDGMAVAVESTTVAEVDRKKLVAAQSIRVAATNKGLKAIRGTPAQKKWAESIRKEMLAMFNDAQLGLIVESEALLSAKFWIDAMQSAKKRAGGFYMQAMCEAITAKL